MFVIPTLEDAFYFVFQMISYLLAIGYKVSFLNGFGNEISNVECTLILGGTSNLYTSLKFLCMMEIEPLNLDMNSECKLTCILKLFTLNNIFYATSILVCKTYIEGKEYVARWGNNIHISTTKSLEI